jgi:hypothetical protein
MWFEIPRPACRARVFVFVGFRLAAEAFAPAVEEMQEAEPLTAEKVLCHPRSD